MQYVTIAAKYADDVLSGKTPACVYVRQACERFVNDLNRNDLTLNVDEAEKWCKFLERLPHVKGKWARKKETLKLSPYQIFCTVNIYGFYKKNGRRRFREAYIEIPRKNGKSFWISGLGLGHLVIDNEFGAEVYCGATTEKQAWEVFRPAKLVCERTPQLREKFGLTVNAKSLTVLENGSRFEPLIGDPGDGASPSCGIADEYHEHKDSDQVDTVVTGMGARENPMMLYITTAGADMGGPCYEKRDEIIKILSGAVKDDSIFGIIYTIDEGDKWDELASLIKANPNYGVSVDDEFLQGELAKARRSPTKQTAFKTKHLNLWVGAKAAWMNMLAFQACRKKKLKLEDFKGEQCFIGVDLASKIDVAAMALVFPPNHSRDHWAAFLRYYVPEEKILEEGNTRYKSWHNAGWLTSTPGNIIDYQYIEDDLDELKSEYEVAQIAYDPFQATQFSTRMSEAGFEMVEFGQTRRNMSEPMKEVEALILNKKFKFELDPVLLWMMSNVVAAEDKRGNILPEKETRIAKIDGIVALIMGVGLAMLNQDDYESIYAKKAL